MTAKAVLIALLVSTAASPFQSSMASSKSAAKKISVTLNKKTLSLKTGQRFRLKVKKKPAKAKVSFSSSKRSVVSVNKTGLVKAKKPGKASITATVKYKGKKKKAVCKVRVVSKKKTINKQIQPICTGSKYTAACTNGNCKAGNNRSDCNTKCCA